MASARCWASLAQVRAFSSGEKRLAATRCQAVCRFANSRAFLINELLNRFASSPWWARRWQFGQTAMTFEGWSGPPSATRRVW